MRPEDIEARIANALEQLRRCLMNIVRDALEAAENRPESLFDCDCGIDTPVPVAKAEQAITGEEAVKERIEWWIRCSDRLPPEDVDVETKVDDEKGCRNSLRLRLHKRCWFFPDMSMYVYYVPTHWKFP